MCWLGAIPPSELRVQFGLRLKGLRLTGGYRTARAFAQALELDENRYTRYERGEVEPSLTTICKICSVLAIQPNDLFRFSSAATGLSASSLQDGAGATSPPQPEPSPPCAATSVISIFRNHSPDLGMDDKDLLAVVRAVGEVYATLPATAAGRFVAELFGATAMLGQRDKAELASIVGDFMRKHAYSQT